MNASHLIHTYFETFNKKSWSEFFALLHPEIIHDINQGSAEIGIAAFHKFMDHMNDCYDEQIVDRVIMVDETGKHASCRFTVKGKYLKTDSTFPAAHGQTYSLPAASLFEIDGQKVKRVTTYYNLNDWLKQVK